MRTATGALLALAAIVTSVGAQAPAGSSTVTGTVSIIRAGKGPVDNGEVAVWLQPLGETGPRNGSAEAGPRVRQRIIQQNKRFSPHLLVVPVGAVVEFPNLDPFFHNVFSMFDGKRFDLGLYEAGTSRMVPFTRPGVCYVFCNIHPDMSAVVVAVDTPYYAVTNRAGEFTVPNVPAGRYALSVWHERHKPEHPGEWPRAVAVTGATTSIDGIRLIESDDVIVAHKNKYGHDYTPPAPSSPIYRDR